MQLHFLDAASFRSCSFISFIWVILDFILNVPAQQINRDETRECKADAGHAQQQSIAAVCGEYAVKVDAHVCHDHRIDPLYVAFFLVYVVVRVFHVAFILFLECFGLLLSARFPVLVVLDSLSDSDGTVIICLDEF